MKSFRHRYQDPAKRISSTCAVLSYLCKDIDRTAEQYVKQLQLKLFQYLDLIQQLALGPDIDRCTEKATSVYNDVVYRANLENLQLLLGDANFLS